MRFAIFFRNYLHTSQKSPGNVVGGAALPVCSISSQQLSFAPFVFLLPDQSTHHDTRKMNYI